MASTRKVLRKAKAAVKRTPEEILVKGSRDINSSLMELLEGDTIADVHLVREKTRGPVGKLLIDNTRDAHNTLIATYKKNNQIEDIVDDEV